MMKKILIFCCLAMMQTNLLAQGGPTMGWSSWNTYGVNISDALIRRQADAMVSKGLKAVGYDHINIDDGFFGGRDTQTGELKIHPTRFPRGLKPVADYIHQKGLKAGIYSDAGANTNWTFTLIGTDNLNVESMAHSFAIEEHLEFHQDERGTKEMFERERRGRERYCCSLHENKPMPKGSFFEEEKRQN